MEFSNYCLDKLQITQINQTAEIHHISVMVRAGSRFEMPRVHGIAHLWEHMMFKSTTESSSYDLLYRLEAIGADISAYTTKEKICLHASYPKEYGTLVLDTLFEMLTSSAFETEELTTEKEVIYDEMDSYDDSPYELIFDDFEDQLFAKHPLGHKILGTKSSLGRITPEDLFNYRKQNLTKDNICIAVYGDLDRERLEYWTKDLPLSAPMTAAAPFSANVSSVSTEKDTSQIHYMIGGIGYSHTDTSLIGLKLIMNYLSSSAITSVLNYELREKRGICYNIESIVNSYQDIGLWGIYLGTHPDKIDEAKAVCLSEFEKLTQSPFSYDTLEAIKVQYIGQRNLALANPLNLTLSCASSLLYTSKPFDNSMIMRQISQVTAEELQCISQHIFSPQQLSTLQYD